MTDQTIPIETLNKSFMLMEHWKIESYGWTEEQCAAHFEKKHGKQPEYMFDRFGYLWMGPIEHGRQDEQAG